MRVADIRTHVHETEGLLNLRKPAVVAAAGGLPVNGHAVIRESGVSTLAAIPVLATIPNLTDGHQVMHELVVEDVLVCSLVSIDSDRSLVPDTPGLGIEIDWDCVEGFERLFEHVGQYPM